jgi:hypothetical protein
MTKTTTRIRIAFPAWSASRLDQLGGDVGALLPDRPDLRCVDLPAGWTTDLGQEQGVPGRILDQHGRPRIGVSWTYHTTVESFAANRATSVEPHVTVLDPGSHARAVAEHGVPLVLDTWATPGAMLGVVGERIDTFTRLIYVAERSIQRWQVEQPETAARERRNRESYGRKLNAYTSLLKTLTQAITSGWTPEWPRA